MMKLKKVLVLFRPDYARVKPLLDAIGDFSKELDLRVHSYSEWLARADKDIQGFEKVFLLVEDIEANIELLSGFCDLVENLEKFKIFGLPPRCSFTSTDYLVEKLFPRRTCFKI